MSFQDYNLCHHVVCIHRYWSLNLLLINALYLKKKKSHAGISSMLDLWIFIRLLRGAERSNRIRTKGSPRLWTALTLCACTGADGLIDAVINSLRTNFLFQWKMQTVVSQVLINCIVPDPHIELLLGKPKALSRPYWYKYYNKVMLYCKLTKT